MQNRIRYTNKKEEFPGFMDNMLSGNSFPQICVVSVNESSLSCASASVQYCSVHKLRKECE